MARIPAARPPAASCRLPVAPAITLAAVIVPETLPSCGHCGARPVGSGLVAVWHRKMTTLPFTPSWPAWMWDCVTVPCSPLYVSVYWMTPWGAIVAVNAPVPVVDTEGDSSEPVSNAPICSGSAPVVIARRLTTTAVNNLIRTGHPLWIDFELQSGAHDSLVLGE